MKRDSFYLIYILVILLIIFDTINVNPIYLYWSLIKFVQLSTPALLLL
jgi:hypothetical protein